MRLEIMDIHQIIIAAAETVQHTAEAQKPNVLDTLGINWKLFLAQLVNFSIVLFIFWKWIAKPLSKTLMQRQGRIESGLKNADLMEQEKKIFDEWKKEEMRKARNEADKILKATSEEADKIKNETISTAQAQAVKVIEQAHANITEEKEHMLKEAKQELATLVVAASEKILRTKLDSKKDQELISESLRTIR